MLGIRVTTDCSAQAWGWAPELKWRPRPHGGLTDLRFWARVGFAKLWGRAGYTSTERPGIKASFEASTASTHNLPTEDPKIHPEVRQRFANFGVSGAGVSTA